MADGSRQVEFRLTVSQSVRMVGNSVSPLPQVAVIRANLPRAERLRAAA